MKVLFLNPPFLGKFGKFSRSQRSPAITKSGTFYYPIWLAYATGVLEENGFEVQLIDAPAEKYDREKVYSIIKKFSPKLIVIDTSTPSIYNDVEIASNIKNLLPNTYVVLVGTHPSALPEETMAISNDIDAIAREEYDYTILELAKLINRKQNFKDSLKDVSGISFRYNNKIIHNPGRPYIRDVDNIPFVSKVYNKHLDVRNYFFGAAQYPVVQIMTSRGCPHHCIWCVYPQTFHGRSYRPRSPKNVVDEIEYIIRHFPDVKDIGFEDDTFTIDQNRTVEICDEILRRNLKISWYTNTRVDLKLETMYKMKKAGCRLITTGFESGNPEILKRIKKGITVEQIKTFMKNTHKAKILVHGCIVAGNPGETLETLEESYQLSKFVHPETMQYFPMMVYPGTEAYNWAKANRYLDTNDFSKWVTKTGLHNCVVSLPNLSSRELVEWCDKARRRYYLRPKYLFYKFLQLFTHPLERERTFKQFKNFWKYLIFGSFHNTSVKDKK